MLVSMAAGPALGCLSEALPGTPRRDGGELPDGAEADRSATAPPAPAVLGLNVEDARGRDWSAGAAPLRPVLRFRARGDLRGTPEPFMLLEGAPDPGLAADLGRSPPLTLRRQARLVAADVERATGAVLLRPREALAPGARYAVAVAGWAVDAHDRELADPFMAELRTADEGGGARLRGVFPADGTPGVPTDLPTVSVWFDGPVEGLGEGLVLESAAGPVDARVERLACADAGFPDGHCAAIRPGPLAPGQRYRIRITAALVDHTGASIGPKSLAFTTGMEALGPRLVWSALPCAMDETPVEVGCLLATDARLTLRVRASGPARLWLHGGGRTDRQVAPRGEATLALGPFEPSTGVRAALRTVDLAGREQRQELELATTAPLASVGISEVRADPRGPEPQQEYVEVHNAGATPIDLRGFSLSDRPDREGDVVSGPARLPPGARALLVADGFDPGHPDDPPVPAGVPLIRIGASLASGGLTNAGEALFLRDPEGRRVSAAPATPAPRSGVCIVRAVGDLRTGADGSFAYDATGGCTPGTAPQPP